MKTIKSWLRLLPLLPVVFLFAGCYTYYANLQAQDWTARDAWVDEYDGDVVEVPPVAVFLNPFMFTPCAPPVVYPVYDWYHRCWIPESEFGLWLQGPDMTIAFQWGMDWRFGIRNRHWFRVSRWHMDHPHYRGPRHYADWESGHDRGGRTHGSRYTPPRQQNDRWRDDPRDDHWDGDGGFSGRDDNHHPDQDPGQGNSRQKEQPPKNRNRSFDRQDPARDRETAGTVRRTPPPASTGTLQDAVHRIVIGPAETDRERTTRNTNGRGNGTGYGNTESQARRVIRPAENREPAANRTDSRKPMTWDDKKSSFRMPAFPDTRNRSGRVGRQSERPAPSAEPSKPRLKTGSSGNVESPRIQTEIRTRNTGGQADRGVKTNSRDSGKPASRHSRR
ncbi:MAG: hypothetical protein QUS35_07955 [bacterium]|nr:hypothetical protein [bacterium]